MANSGGLRFGSAPQIPQSRDLLSRVPGFIVHVVRRLREILPRVIFAVKPRSFGALRSPVAAQAVSSPQVRAHRGKTECGVFATLRRRKPELGIVQWCASCWRNRDLRRGQSSLAFGGGPSAERVRGAVRRVYRQSQTEGTEAPSIRAHGPFSGCGRHGLLGLVGVRAQVGGDPEKRPGIETQCATANRRSTKAGV